MNHKDVINFLIDGGKIMVNAYKSTIPQWECSECCANYDTEEEAEDCCKICACCKKTLVKEDDRVITFLNYDAKSEGTESKRITGKVCAECNNHLGMCSMIV